MKEGEPQIPRFARDDKKGRVVVKKEGLPKERAASSLRLCKCAKQRKASRPTSGLLSQTPSPLTNTLSSHKHPLLSQTPSPFTNTLSFHKHPLLSQTPSPSTNTLSFHKRPLLWQTPFPFTNTLSYGKRPLLRQTPSPFTDTLSFDKHPFIQQPPSPYNNPLLFVIPSEARDLRFSFRLAKSPLATTPLCHPEPQPTSIC